MSDDLKWPMVPQEPHDINNVSDLKAALLREVLVPPESRHDDPRHDLFLEKLVEFTGIYVRNRAYRYSDRETLEALVPFITITLWDMNARYRDDIDQVVDELVLRLRERFAAYKLTHKREK